MLIVEDDTDIAQLEVELLRGHANVQLVTDQFHRVFRPELWQGIDVAVMDLMLPTLQGEDICRFLIHEFPHIKRVICTAKPTYLIPDLQNIAHVVLQKPFSQHAFVFAVCGNDS